MVEDLDKRKKKLRLSRLAAIANVVFFQKRTIASLIKKSYLCFIDLSDLKQKTKPMQPELLLSQYQQLPSALQEEVLHFVGYLLYKTKQVSEIKEVTNPTIRKAGSLKGAFIVPDDFNEPLADFKDYM
jgi:hypothetical protein